MTHIRLALALLMLIPQEASQPVDPTSAPVGVKIVATTLQQTGPISSSGSASAAAGTQFRYEGLNVEQEAIAQWATDLYAEAAERAAEIIGWPLMDRPVPTVSRYGTSCAELEAGYRPVTGVAPVHGYTDHCPTEHLEIQGGSVEQRATVMWAAGRFKEVGLDFPRPPLYLYEGTMQCGGYAGSTHVLPESVTVHVCVEGHGDLARIVLHEFAHAWDLAFGGISKETRTDFLALRGLGEWNDSNDDWAERGAEQAAEIIAWGLQESVARIPTRVALAGPNDLESLASAFQVLVGAPPLWMEDVNRLRSVRSTGSWHDV
jgi:hypothetical protein